MKSKSIKKWAVCFYLNKKCLSGHIDLFDTRSQAKTFIKEEHQRYGGFESDHHIVRVLITSTNK